MGSRDGRIALGVGLRLVPPRKPYLPTGSACGPGADIGARGADGSAINGTSGVSSPPASHGSAVAKALLANGQSCLPGCSTTAHLIPFALPVAHSEFAAAVWSLGLAAAFTT